MSTPDGPQGHICNGTDCADDDAHYDALVAANPNYGLPWGWSRHAWDGYVETSMARALWSAAGRTNDDTVKALKASQAWCVFVAILSTAAMALAHEAWSIKYSSIFEDGGAR
jgi:hypothetical protein